MAYANGQLPTSALTALPTSWSNAGRQEYLEDGAAASLGRMLIRAVAHTGQNFQLYDAYRPLSEQVAILKRYYRRVHRGRSLSTDRSWDGSTWAKRAGFPAAASPGHSNHGTGHAIDLYPSKIQAWVQKNGRAYGWTWDEGRKLGEGWHFVYQPSLDRFKAEGTVPMEKLQKALGVTADGKFGTGTCAKVKAWQKAHGLTADGIPGPDTQAAILAGKAEAAPEAAAPAESVTAESSTPVQDAAATPGWMPGADTSQTWDGNPHKETVGKLVLHTTEGSGFTDYSGGSMAPHFTVKPGPADSDHIRQHIPTTEASKALAHPSGTVETNNAGVVQIEFVGSCDADYAEKHGLFFTEDADDDDLEALAAVVAWVHAAHGIPLETGLLSWPTTNAAYATAPQRLTDHEWEEYRGVLGHTHVPHNEHWDPGAFPVARLLELAGGAAPKATTTPTTSSVTLPEGKDLLMKLKDLPDFPLLRTAEHLCYYGDEDKMESVSGKMPNSLNPGDITGTGTSSGARGLKAWQKKVGLKADGRFGPVTDQAARKIQQAAGLTVDGKIGPATFYAAWLI
ncbi:peptidoglycan-binding protein [Brachybacterium kimchii]|uniref:Peptidoglycan-binding protein n=1 Tax=Brachybacterium kimchii TaxID=2942909 RepID=A0ABY4N4J6_9MICO|nr:peptidoglycan-binding protein [Brachybacterium kimchii]UQN29490.1 peptidoglycan-binding protein [Brachybacterium kimchii]